MTANSSAASSVKRLSKSNLERRMSMVSIDIQCES